MRKFLMCVVLALCCLLALGAVPQGSAALRASVVTGQVVINGVTIDNFGARFPLLRFRGVDYVPLTYHMARFLGLWSHYTPETGLVVNRARGVAEFVPDEGVFNRAQSVPVALPTHAEPYPLLSYAGTTYFPLTPRFAAQGHPSAGLPKTKPC